MPLIIAAIAVGTVGGVYGARTVQMTQMPQMVALFNGVGGGAAALVALLELHEVAQGGGAPWFNLAATAFTIAVGSVSFAGSVVTFAKLQELMTSRPVVFPGLPVALRRLARRGRRARRRARRSTRTMWVGVVLALLGLLIGLLLVLPVGGADVPIVISMLNAFTGLTVAAGGYVLSQRAAAHRRHAGRRLRHVPDPADGQRDGPLRGQHPVRRAQGRLDPRRRRGLATARSSAPTPRTSRSCWRTPTG